MPSRGGAASSDDYIESSTLNGASRTSPDSNKYKAPVYAKVKSYNQNSSDEQTSYEPPAAPVPEARGGGTIVVEPGQRPLFYRPGQWHDRGDARVGQ